MKRSTIVTAVLAALLGLVIIIAFIDIEIRSENDFNVVRNFGPIKKIEMSTYYDAQKDKERITITDSKILDSLNTSLRSLDHAITIDIAKANDVNVYVDVYKGKETAKLRVVNSVYTGWVLIIGNLKFRDEYVFGLVKRYMPQ